jgi:hypothetical protein
MSSRLTGIWFSILAQPRLAVLLALTVFFAASGGAMAVEGVGEFGGVTLGDVGTSDTGNVDGGPTDP